MGCMHWEGKGVAQSQGQIVQSPVWKGKELTFILNAERAQRSLEWKLHEGREARDRRAPPQTITVLCCPQLYISLTKAGHDLFFALKDKKEKPGKKHVLL